jgi:hypothetical protein
LGLSLSARLTASVTTVSGPVPLPAPRFPSPSGSPHPLTLSMQTAELWCLIINDEQPPKPIGTCIRFKLPLGACAQDLLEKIKENDPSFPPLHLLKVFKAEEPRPLSEVNKPPQRLLEYTTKLQLSYTDAYGDEPTHNASVARFLSHDESLSPDGIAWGDRMLHFLVQIPSVPGTSQSPC